MLTSRVEDWGASHFWNKFRALIVPVRIVFKTELILSSFDLQLISIPTHDTEDVLGSTTSLFTNHHPPTLSNVL